MDNPAPSPAFVLEFSPEEVGCCVGRLVLEMEGSAVDLVWDAVAEVEGTVVDPVGDVAARVEDGAVAFTKDAGVDVDKLFVDSVLDKPLVILGM